MISQNTIFTRKMNEITEQLQRSNIDSPYRTRSGLVRKQNISKTAKITIKNTN